MATEREKYEKAERYFLSRKAMRLMTDSQLATLSQSFNIPRAGAVAWLRGLVRRGFIAKVRRGLYVNMLAKTKVEPSELASYIKSGSVVSLDSVLKEARVINNKDAIVSKGAQPVYDAVYPVPAGGKGKLPAPKDISTPVGHLRLYGMPHKYVVGKDIERAGGFQEKTRYPKAAPEKALLDWLYLAQPHSYGWSWVNSPSKNIDLSKLNIAKLKNLANIMGMTKTLDIFIKEARGYQSALSVYEEEEKRRAETEKQRQTMRPQPTMARQPRRM